MMILTLFVMVEIIKKLSEKKTELSHQSSTVTLTVTWNEGSECSDRLQSREGILWFARPRKNILTYQKFPW